MPTLTKAPTPKQFANAWTRGFAKAVRDAAGRDGRLSRNEANQISDRGDALASYGNNVENWFAITGQSSVSVEKLIRNAHAYAEISAKEVAGRGNRVSLVEARNLPEDLQDDFFRLRGKAPTSNDGGTAPASDAKADATAAVKALNDVQFVDWMDDRVATDVRTYTNGASLDDVKNAITAEFDGHSFWNLTDPIREHGTGSSAVELFLKDTNDGLVDWMKDEGEDTSGVEAFAAKVRELAGGDDVEQVSMLGYWIYGSQIDKERSALVVEKKDGSVFSIDSDSVWY